MADVFLELLELDDKVRRSERLPKRQRRKQGMRVADRLRALRSEPRSRNEDQMMLSVVRRTISLLSDA
jgi:hypothetical protein